MPDELRPRAPGVRIAIVGAGVSGLVAAHLLHREHEIVMYEAGSYIGGHTNTIRVDTAHETHQVDTGFIVMNDRNYPNFTRLLGRLGVATQPTSMSFSVKAEDEDFEYAGTPAGLYCQPSNLVSVRFQRMIVDLLRFNRALGRLLEQEPGSDESLGAFLQRHSFSRGFVDRLIVPQVSAVWSADPRGLRTFPVRFLAEFFSNHGMLGFTGRPRWSTIAGGSARYVDALAAPFRERVRLLTPVREIARGPGGVSVRADGCEPERFDHVVIATHSGSGALAARRPERARAGAARGDPLPGERGGAAHRQLAAAPAPARSRCVELSPAARAERGEHGHVLHEPPAAAAVQHGLLRHAEPDAGDRPLERDQAHRVLAPRLHRGGGRRAGQL